MPNEQECIFFSLSCTHISIVTICCVLRVHTKSWYLVAYCGFACPWKVETWKLELKVEIRCYSTFLFQIPKYLTIRLRSKDWLGLIDIYRARIFILNSKLFDFTKTVFFGVSKSCQRYLGKDVRWERRNDYVILSTISPSAFLFSMSPLSWVIALRYYRGEHWRLQ